MKKVLYVLVLCTLLTIFTIPSVMRSMMIPVPVNKSAMVSQSLFAKGLKKIREAIEQQTNPIEGIQLLIQAAIEYNNPHAQYAIYALAKNNIIQIPAEHANNPLFEHDFTYYNQSTISQVDMLIKRAKYFAAQKSDNASPK